MSNKKLRIAIVGSTGYGGVELIRLLNSHPNVEITSVISAASPGKLLSDAYPHLSEIVVDALDAVNANLIKEKADLVFTATPSGVSTTLAPELLEVGLKVIDLAGDYRIKDATTFEKWYKHTAPAEPFLQDAYYSLAEVHGDQAGKSFISNPGCYPTATLLGLIPAIKAGLISTDGIIIDAKSGVSGAGRGTSQLVHYSEINENFLAYKVNKHQHIPEIEQVLTEVAGTPVTVTFTTHLVPMTRGILSTMYAKVNGNYTDADFINAYREFYKGRRFVRIRPEGKYPATKEVSGSNYCDIGFNVDARTGRVTILSVIDNLVKGAAGQAIQNMNLMMGWDETLGLNFVPMYP